MFRPFNPKTLGDQFFCRFIERAALKNIMAHLIAQLPPAGFAGMGWMQAQCFHLLGPLTIVIPATTRRPQILLPEMNHLMDERGERFFDRALFKIGGVQRNLVAGFAVMPLKAMAAKIAEGT